MGGISQIATKEYEFIKDYEDNFIYDEINIKINGNSTFDIFARIYFATYEYEEFEGESNVKAANVNLFLKLLLKMIGVNQDEWDETFMGAPYDDCCVGYHELPFNMLYVNSFFSVWNVWNENRSTGDKYD